MGLAPGGGIEGMARLGGYRIVFLYIYIYCDYDKNIYAHKNIIIFYKYSFSHVSTISNLLVMVKHTYQTYMFTRIYGKNIHVQRI